VRYGVNNETVRYSRSLNCVLPRVASARDALRGGVTFLADEDSATGGSVPAGISFNLRSGNWAIGSLFAATSSGVSSFPACEAQARIVASFYPPLSAVLRGLESAGYASLRGAIIAASFLATGLLMYKRKAQGELIFTTFSLASIVGLGVATFVVAYVMFAGESATATAACTSIKYVAARMFETLGFDARFVSADDAFGSLLATGSFSVDDYAFSGVEWASSVCGMLLAIVLVLTSFCKPVKLGWLVRAYVHACVDVSHARGR